MGQYKKSEEENLEENEVLEIEVETRCDKRRNTYYIIILKSVMRQLYERTMKEIYKLIIKDKAGGEFSYFLKYTLDMDKVVVSSSAES